MTIAPNATAAITSTPAQYRVSVAHGRTERVQHAFRYSQSMWLIDLDDVPRLPLGLGWLASFEARDHLGDPDRSLRANLDAYGPHPAHQEVVVALREIAEWVICDYEIPG